MLNVLDVTDAKSVRNAATQLKDVAIDVLINSAGIAGASGQKTGNVDYESWAHIFNVNTMGPLRVLESFSDHIASSRPKSEFFGGIEPNRIFDRARRDRAGVRFAAEGSRLHDLAREHLLISPDRPHVFVTPNVIEKACELSRVLSRVVCRPLLQSRRPQTESASRIHCW